MATIKEFKKWLEQFPEETIIQVAIQEQGTSYESYGPAKFRDFKIPTGQSGEGFNFDDFRNNQFTKPDDPWSGKCFLELGEVR